MTALPACCSHPAVTRLHWSQLPPLPDPRGVAAPFAGVSGGALLVAGGANFPDKMPWEGGRKVWYDQVYALTGADLNWKLVGKLPRPLAYGVSLTTDYGVVCAGGSDAERHYPDVFLLAFTNGTLRTHPLPNLPIPLANAAGALVGSTIYLAGGSEQPGEQQASGRCFALDLAQPKPAWNEIEPCPGKARILPVAAAIEKAFYFVGGAALEPADGKVARVYLHDAWRYRPSQGWERLADLPKPCVAAPTPAPALDHRFFLVGGDDGTRAGFRPIEKHPGFPRTILAYDTQANSWRESGEVPAARATVPAVFWQNRFVIPSGEMRPGVRSPEVWALEAGAAR